MKAKTKLKKYTKARKYDSGTQVLNPALDPTTQYQTNRGTNANVSMKDTEFNNAQQSMTNRGVQQQQLQDKTSSAKQDFANVGVQDQKNHAAIGAIGSAAFAVNPIVGGAIIAANTITSATDKDRMKRMQQTGNVNAGLGDAVVSGVLNPLGAGLNLLEGNSAKKEFLKQQQAQKQQTDINSQITKYGKIDDTVQSAQANKGLKKIKYKTGAKDVQLDNLINSHSKSYGEIEEQESPKIEKQELIEFKKLKKYESKYSFAKGVKKVDTRIIETQGKEPVFTPKDNEGKRDLIYYNPSDPTHEEGGVKAAVIPKSGKDRVRGMLNIPEGSAIVTSHQGMNKKALEAYKEGDDNKLERVINKMPEDKKGTVKKKYKGIKRLDDGTDNVQTNPANKWALANQSNNQNGSLQANQNQIPGGYGFGNYSSTNRVNQNTPQSSAAAQSSTNTNVSSATSKLGNAGNGLLQAAPSIYNLGRGLFDKAQKTNRRYISNQDYQYKDTSAPAIRAANEQQLVNSNNIRNATGGQGGAFLANQAMASADRFKNISDINNQQMAQRQNISNSNVDMRNQQNQSNLGLANQYDQQDLENKAAHNQYTQAGLTGISDIAARNKLMSNQANADSIRAGALQEKNYAYDPKTGKPIYKKEAKGTKKLKANKSLRYKNK